LSRQVDVLPPAEVLAELDQAVDMQKLEDVLMVEGIEKFVAPQRALLALIAAKRAG
jgi:transaldolase